jgi:hypothetical protein
MRNHLVKENIVQRLIVVLVFILSGCATSRYLAFNESEYHRYGTIIAASEVCFEAGMVSTDLMSQTQSNMKTVLSIRDYDIQKLTDLYLKRKAFLNQQGATVFNCRETEVQMKNIIALGKKIDRNHAIQASKPAPQYFTNTGGNRLFCNTVGSMTFCN